MADSISQPGVIQEQKEGEGLNTLTLLPSPSSPVKESSGLIDKAVQAAERLEAANKRSEEIATRMEAAAARLMLSGRAEAGSVQKTPEQIQKEEADKEAERIIKRFRMR